MDERQERDALRAENAALRARVERAEKTLATLEESGECPACNSSWDAQARAESEVFALRARVAELEATVGTEFERGRAQERRDVVAWLRHDALLISTSVQTATRKPNVSFAEDAALVSRIAEHIEECEHTWFSSKEGG